jgi:hypothetical protein
MPRGLGKSAGVVASWMETNASPRAAWRRSAQSFTTADFSAFGRCVQAVLTSCTHLPDLGLGHEVGSGLRKCKRPGQRWCAARDLNTNPQIKRRTRPVMTGAVG